jgi:ABC-type transporter MlaC component
MLWCVTGISMASGPEQPSQVVQRLISVIGSLKTRNSDQVLVYELADEIATARTAIAMLDIAGISQEALGEHWKTCNSTEKQEFLTLFRNLLGKIAFWQMANVFSSLHISITEQRVSGSQAVVSTAVRHPKEGAISIDYLMRRNGQIWQVHDIALDGVSVGRSLQGQFHKILSQHSFPELLRFMQAKLSGTNK